MTDNNKTLEINLVELVNLAAQILDGLFIRAKKDQAKAAFKEIKKGNKVELGTVTIQKTIESKLNLTLDYSQFVGPGFNFDGFELALKGILGQISEKFKAKADLNVMNDDQGSVLIHLPGLIQRDGQLNAMVLIFNIANLKEITIQLAFVEPSQYDAVRKNA